MEQPDKRKQAMRIWLQSGGRIPIRDIADRLGVKPDAVRQWKRRDNWEQKLKEQQNKKNSDGVTDDVTENVTDDAENNGGVTEGENTDEVKKPAEHAPVPVKTFTPPKRKLPVTQNRFEDAKKPPKGTHRNNEKRFVLDNIRKTNLTDEELEMLDDLLVDEEKTLITDIKRLILRESRLMAQLNKLQKETVLEESSVTVIDAYNREKTTKKMKSNLPYILAVERELTLIANAKTKALAELGAIREARQLKDWSERPLTIRIRRAGAANG